MKNTLLIAATYTVTPTTFTCHFCGMTSHHLSDRAYAYCGACHLFHDEIHHARRRHLLGYSHRCADWPTAGGICAVCEQVLEPTEA